MKGNYQNGKIYKIEPIVDHDENGAYYGSTTQLLCKRMGTHRGHYKLWKTGKRHKCSVRLAQAEQETRNPKLWYLR